jgi:hypothetical protein
LTIGNIKEDIIHEEEITMPQVENWLGFDATKAVFDLRSESVDDVEQFLHANRQNIDVASVLNYSSHSKSRLTELGFFEAPIKITWRRNVESIKDYIKSVKKGRDIKRGLNLIEEGKRYSDVEFKIDRGLTNDDWYQKWFRDFYVTKLGEKPRPRFNLQEKPSGHTGFYAFKGNDLVGGRLVKDIGDRFSASFSVFNKRPRYLNDIAYAKMMEEAVRTGKREVSLGVDINFYGYHLSIGTMRSKVLFGFEPYYYPQAGKNFFRVLKTSKFNNPFMFFSFLNNTDSLINNIFLRQGIFFDKSDYTTSNGVRMISIDNGY